MKDFFLSWKKKWGAEALSLMGLRGVIERTLFRWGVIVRSKFWTSGESGWIWVLKGQDGSNSDAFAGAFADAFADGKNFLLMVQLMLSIVTVYSYKHEYNRWWKGYHSNMGMALSIYLSYLVMMSVNDHSSHRCGRCYGICYGRCHGMC